MNADQAGLRILNLILSQSYQASSGADTVSRLVKLEARFENATIEVPTPQSRANLGREVGLARPGSPTITLSAPISSVLFSWGNAE